MREDVEKGLMLCAVMRLRMKRSQSLKYRRETRKEMWTRGPSSIMHYGIKIRRTLDGSEKGK